MIYKAFFGMHIDLERIIGVSDIREAPGVAGRGPQWAFQIDVQLRDMPILVQYAIPQPENGTITPESERARLEAFEKLSADHDTFVDAWKRWKVESGAPLLMGEGLKPIIPGGAGGPGLPS